MSFTPPAGFKEALAPELFKFEKKDDVLEGILMQAKVETIKGDKVIELYFNTGRRVVRYRPGFDVRSKINKTMIGKHVIIHYQGDDAERGKEGNALKVFGVYVKGDERDTGFDDNDPGITDDDIPF
jgi:hypothetical protein